MQNYSRSFKICLELVVGTLNTPTGLLQLAMSDQCGFKMKAMKNVEFVSHFRCLKYFAFKNQDQEKQEKILLLIISKRSECREKQGHLFLFSAPASHDWMEKRKIQFDIKVFLIYF